MKILLISGFLGAGKTTFIKNIAKKFNMEFVVLENEYADVGMDADFLKEDNLNIWEMSEGCICCSMNGDFKDSLRAIYQQINPEYVLVEPTGVGMLSSIIKNIQSIKDCEITLLNPLTMIDVSCFDEYLENFRDYFTDNLLNSGKIFLTKLDTVDLTKIFEIKKEILKINPNLEIVTEDYRKFNESLLVDIFNTNLNNKVIDAKFSLASHINLRTFSQTNINFSSMDRFGIFMDRLINGDFGKIYRAKGIINIEGQWGKFNLVHKIFEMEAAAPAKESKIAIIGNNLNINEIKKFIF